jgi:ribonuclease Z
MKFEVTILGSGSSLPTIQRNPTAQFVECNNRFILVDCGEGTQIQLRRFKIKFQKIDVVLISHLHGDHYFGLPGLISSMHLLGREKKLYIVGPEELEALIRPLLDIGGCPLNFDLEFIGLSYPENRVVFEDKKVSISSFPLKHRIPAHGYVISEKVTQFKLNKPVFDEYNLRLSDIPKIKNGEDIIAPDGKIILNKELVLPSKTAKRYAFCSDTKYAESIVPFIREVDLLYHEATFTNEHKSRAIQTFHSTAEDAAKIAQLADVKRLLIGHFSPRYNDTKQHENEAKSTFSNIQIAEDGLVIKI